MSIYCEKLAYLYFGDDILMAEDADGPHEIVFNMGLLINCEKTTQVNVGPRISREHT